MLKFIEIGDQIKCQLDYSEETPATDFALWDTIIDRFLVIGNKQVFNSVEDFIECFNYYEGYPHNRLLGVIPDKFFVNHPRDYYERKDNH